MQFIIFGDLNTPFAVAYSAEYTQRTEVAHPRALTSVFTPEQRQHREAEARRYRQDIEDMGAPPDDDDEAAHDFHLRRMFLLRKVAAYTAEPTMEEILRHDKVLRAQTTDLMRTKCRFRDFPVQVAYKTHRNKGRRGVVIDERDSDQRRARLAALTGTRHAAGVQDIKGILCTVRYDGTNNQEEIPIENLVHR